MVDIDKKIAVKIASTDIMLKKKENKTNLVITIDFLIEKNKTKYITIDFAQSNLRFINFVNILLNVVAVNKWSELAGKKVFVLFDKNSIYRICNTENDKLFLDFQEFFDVDC